MSLKSKDIYEFGPFRLDASEHLLLRAGEAVPLSPKAFDLLLTFVKRHGSLLGKDELLKLVWPDTFVEEANLASNISQLRRALGERENGHRYIETVPKHGYRFVAAVTYLNDRETLHDDPPLSDIVDDSAEPQESITSLAAPDAGSPIVRIKRYKRSIGIVLAALVVTIPVLAYYVLRTPGQPKVLSSSAVTTDGRKKVIEHSGGKWNTSVVTDGARLYYVDLDDRRVVKQVAVTGGESTELPGSFEGGPLVMDLSPNHTELLIKGKAASPYEAELWVMPVMGGSHRRLGDIEGHAAAWSPDGQQIVYANGTDLHLVKSDGTQSRKLTTVVGRPQWPRWAPNGRRIRFTVRDDKTNLPSLWEIAADGTTLHPLLPGWNKPAGECCGNWTPDGRYYVFQSTRNWTTSVWAVQEEGSFFQQARPEPVRLPLGPMNFYAPVPSPDGKKLFAVGEVKLGELVRYDAPTQQWVSYLQGISADGVDFSPDGGWVTYSRYPEGDLWRSRVDGSAKLQLSFSSMRTWLPRWSPDGKQIAFAAQLPGRPWKIYQVSANGGNARPLTDDERGEYDPSWSQDGKTLIFHAGTQIDHIAIYLLDLTTSPHKLSKLPDSDDKFSPRWSPDGRYVVGLTYGTQKLVLYDSTTQVWTELASTRCGGPRWSKDGKYVYYLTPFDGPTMFRISINDRKIEQLVSLKNLRVPAGVFGGWVGWTPDDTPLTIRDHGIQDIYALEWQAP